MASALFGVHDLLMFERVQKRLDRIESRIALWTIIQGSGIVTAGAISGWLASATAWVDSYGTVGWWFAALSGALLTALTLSVFAWLRYTWFRADAMRKWKQAVDGVNPLAPEFQRQRVKLLDLSHPLFPVIENKRFIDCELLGPANIILMGKINLTNVAFLGCDLVVVKLGAVLANVIRLDNVQIFGGTISGCTIFVVPAQLPMFAQVGATSEERTKRNPRLKRTMSVTNRSLSDSLGTCVPDGTA